MSTSPYHLISAEKAKEMIDAGDVTIVDVRTSAEYKEGHIPGAYNLPLDAIAATPPVALPDKDATLIVYCLSGGRSKNASKKLVAMGYTQVFDMSGGIMGWGYDVQTGND